jgi:putative SOS response-associated peptidase YedK
MVASNFQPRFNVAPTQNSLVVRNAEGRRELADLRWGLLPPWAKSPADGSKMINARSETVATSRAYRAAFAKRPCLVVADGFYEWKSLDGGGKEPFFITTRNRAPFAFAGLWELKTLADRDTFTIMTCEPNELCRQVHNRMPLMVSPEQWPRWLGTTEDRVALLRPFDAERMEMWPVGKAVGNPRHEGPELIEPMRDEATNRN